MELSTVLDELPLPLSGTDADLQVLAIAMILESELAVRLTDSELTVQALGDRQSIRELLVRHGFC